MSKNKIENPLMNKVLPKRDVITIRLISDENQDIIYEYDRFIEQRILQHKDSKKKTPKPKVNDFYLNALIRGIKSDLFDNKTDEIAEIVASAVNKVMSNQNDEIRRTNNATNTYLLSNMEQIQGILNYILPILQSLAPEYFEITLDNESGFVKKEFFETPLGFEEIQNEILSKWKNKIKKDYSSKKVENTLFKKRKRDY